MKNLIYILFFLAYINATSQYYVTANATGGGNGLSEANSWTLNEAFDNPTSGDVVNIKAGNYGSGSYTVDIAGVSYVGYNNTIGDLNTIDGQPRAFTYGDDVDPSTYPTLIGTFTNDRGVGRAINITASNVRFENFDIKYYESPFRSVGNNNEIKNIFTYNSGNFNATDVAQRPFNNTVDGGYQGKGLTVNGDDVRVINCIAVDHGAESIIFRNTERAHGEGNRVYGGVKNNSTDYHYLLGNNSDNGTHTNIYVERVISPSGEEPEHFGHGIVLKGESGSTITGNVITNSTVINTFLEFQFPAVTGNLAENITLIREDGVDDAAGAFSGGIMVKNGADANKFKNIYIDNSSIWMWDQIDGAQGDIADSGDNNVFENIVWDNTNEGPSRLACITFGYVAGAQRTSVSSDNNRFSNCSCNNSNAFIDNKHPVTGGIYENISISNVPKAFRATSDNFRAEPHSEIVRNINLFNSFSSTPTGWQNVTVGNPLYTGVGTEAERFELQENSLLKDSGISVPGLTSDFNNETYKDVPPIGAFDFGGSTTTPPVTPPVTTLIKGLTPEQVKKRREASILHF